MEKRLCIIWDKLGATFVPRLLDSVKGLDIKIQNKSMKALQKGHL